MPVRKYRSVADMPDTPWRRPGDPELYRALASLWAMSRRLRPRRFPAGVYRHRSIEEMGRQRDAWDAEFIALQQPSGRPGTPKPVPRR